MLEFMALVFVELQYMYVNIPSHVEQALVGISLVALIVTVLELQDMCGTFPWSTGTSLSDTKHFLNDHLQSQDHGLGMTPSLVPAR